MGALTDIAGLLVGQCDDPVGLTGVTVVLCPNGATAAVDVRGGAPGTLGTDLLRPENVIEQVQAVALCGGSAFGLAAVTGVVEALREQGHGVLFGGARVPIVPAAVVFDLRLGRPDVYPDAAMGTAAVQSAGTTVQEGCVGAGMGVSVGKVLGVDWAMKSGVGTASERLADGLIVGALVVNNAVGDVVDPASGRILAGARRPSPLPPPLAALAQEPSTEPYPGAGRLLRLLRGLATPPPANTTLVVVATNARLDKAGCQRLAIMAQTGLARTIQPVNTPFDGDTVFALATGEIERDAGPELFFLGTVAADVVARAVIRSVMMARGRGGLPGLADAS